MKRLSLFCGHYGSGKTNIAVNYAVRLREEGKKVTIADLDIVNPYFRTRDSEEMLERAGVRLLTLPYANTNIDMPTIPSEAYSLFRPETGHCVLDIGGDDRGAYVLGQFAPFILPDPDSRKGPGGLKGDRGGLRHRLHRADQQLQSGGVDRQKADRREQGQGPGALKAHRASPGYDHGKAGSCGRRRVPAGPAEGLLKKQEDI